jgi:acetyl-CoA C-acetyltransferase
MTMDSVTFAVNRLCGSAQQAVVSSAQAILLGDADFAIGGGVESMSRGVYMSPAMRPAPAWATPRCSTPWFAR